METIRCLVSIIIPVYNTGGYLAKCLESVINQTYRRIEIILIDDGSSDNSGKICDEYANHDDRIYVIHQENQGVSVTRNVGINKSKGKYIAFIDSDDWIESKMIEVMVSNAENYDGDAVICGYYEYGYYKNDKNKKVKFFPVKEMKVCEKNIFLEELLKISHVDYYNSPWNKLFSRKIIIENKLQYNPEIAFFEDLIFNLGFFNNTKRVILVKDELYNHRVDVTDSLTKKYIKEMWDIQLCLLKKYKKIYINAGLFRMNVKKINAFVIKCFKLTISHRIMYDISPYKVKLEYMKKIINHKEIEEIINNVDVTDRFSSVIVWCLKNKQYNILLLLFIIKNYLFKNMNNLFKKLQLISNRTLAENK
ncbi:MAG: glycosyltransferase [Candidatus Lokiarchaeota archaeon]|nr:glycosyltransferase [Candidatus Lokiarchaeota archaeon]